MRQKYFFIMVCSCTFQQLKSLCAVCCKKVTFRSRQLKAVQRRYHLCLNLGSKRDDGKHNSQRAKERIVQACLTLPSLCGPVSLLMLLWRLWLYVSVHWGDVMETLPAFSHRYGSISCHVDLSSP